MAGCPPLAETRRLSANFKTSQDQMVVLRQTANLHPRNPSRMAIVLIVEFHTSPEVNEILT
jgi:hypothetical protein